LGICRSAVAKHEAWKEGSRSHSGERAVAKQPRTREWSRSNPGQESGREATQDKSVPKARISNGRGLPCVPGFVLTDYKSQSRTMGRVLLGLYGRSGDDKCDIIGMYVELSRCEELEKTRLFQPLRAKDFLESRMHPYLIAGIEHLKRISDKTAEAFAERHAV